jgi:membrane protein
MSLKSTATAKWAAAQQRHAWLRHVVDAWQLMQRNHGNQYAAAITYFSFLALFPLVLLAVSITGFVFAAHPATQASFFNHLTKQLPGSFGDTLRKSIQTAIDNRSSIGVIGLAGVLLTGLGWIANLREAIDAVWGRAQAKMNFLKARLSNLLVLVGLGVGITVSLGLTAVGTSLTGQLLRAVGLDGVPGSTALLKLLGIAIAAASDVIIFWWLLIRLPAQDVPRRIAWRGALLAAVGFEILKIVGTYTIAHTAHSPTAGPFASVIAVLVWIQLVARLMLFACAWTATLTAEDRAAQANRIPVDEPAAVADEDEPAAVSPATVGATLVGAGAVAGAIATWAALRPRAGEAAGPPTRSP